MGWGVVPVQEFYGIHHTHCPQNNAGIPLRSTCTGVSGLVGFAAISASRQVERNQGKSSLAIHGIFEAEDVLMAF
jgi:hypothetical protein